MMEGRKCVWANIYADVKSSIKDFYNYKKENTQILLNLIETFWIFTIISFTKPGEPHDI